MIVTCEKIHPDAILPARATSGSAGFDLYAVENIVMYRMRTYIVCTGLRFKIPNGHLMYVSSKSGLAANHGIFVLNSPGLIDSDYRGLIKVILHNTSETTYTVRKGDKIAQAIILPYPDTYFIEGKVDVDTERGEGGFGSTGK